MSRSQRRPLRVRTRTILGRALRRNDQEPPTHSDVQEGLQELDVPDRRIVEVALPYTMTGVARLAAVVDAVRHCVSRGIPGAVAECGVWRGGSVLAMVLTMQDAGEVRDVYLYDTFEGMTRPTERDVSSRSGPALETWRSAIERGQRPWSQAFGADAFDEMSVRSTLLATGYPEDRVHFVSGMVEETIPGSAPSKIAVLRLDTDWYESTRHELDHLYPRLSAGGVLIIDDYGHWDGARAAVDEYFEDNPPRPLLNRIDYTGRIAVKERGPGPV